MNALVEEIWKDISGYEGKYQISNLGRVKSLARNVRHDGRPRWIRERIRKCHKRNLAPEYKQGFQCMDVVLVDGCEAKHLSVHSLVLEAFVGPRPVDAVGMHLDGNPSNNCLSNLAWGTQRENVLDGLRGKPSKAIIHFTKMQQQQILEMRESGYSCELMAYIFGKAARSIHAFIAKTKQEVAA